MLKHNLRGRILFGPQSCHAFHQSFHRIDALLERGAFGRRQFDLDDPLDAASAKDDRHADVVSAHAVLRDRNRPRRAPGVSCRARWPRPSGRWRRPGRNRRCPSSTARRSRPRRRGSAGSVRASRSGRTSWLTGMPPTQVQLSSGTIVSPCPPSSMAETSSTLTPTSMAMNVRKRAASSTPAWPITRCGGKPVTCHARWTIASNGLLTTMTIASGLVCRTAGPRRRRCGRWCSAGHRGSCPACAARRR